MDHSSNEDGSEVLDYYGEMLSQLLNDEIPIISTMSYIYDLMMLIIDVFII